MNALLIQLTKMTWSQNQNANSRKLRKKVRRRRRNLIWVNVEVRSNYIVNFSHSIVNYSRLCKTFEWMNEWMNEWPMNIIISNKCALWLTIFHLIGLNFDMKLKTRYKFCIYYLILCWPWLDCKICDIILNNLPFYQFLIIPISPSFITNKVAFTISG